MNRSIPISFGLSVFIACRSLAYGPTGHEVVGGIADKLLANTATGTKVNALIDGITLEKAAVIPDEIKSWDKKGADDRRGFPHYSEHPKIDNQLRAFWKANPPTDDPNSPIPSHHWFHYTDVPVLNVEKYADGKTGRSQWDIVHMMRFCVQVLKGEVPEDNPRKITKPVAVILLAHYVGDVHQPLHVGTEYFDRSGQKVDPDRGKPGLEDEGGNSLTLELSSANNHWPTKLHGFWDNDAVGAQFPILPAGLTKKEQTARNEGPKEQLIQRFATEEPKNWRLPASISVDDYGEAWANEIMPVAREAHERLRFFNVHSAQDGNRTIAEGSASEQPMSDHLGYRDWSARVVHDELHRAGWRLADMLKQALTSTTTSATSAPIPPEPLPAEPRDVREPPAQISPMATSAYGGYPANYKEIVAKWMKANGFDVPKIDWQSEPKPADVPALNGRHLYGYLVIFNTPDRSGTKTRSILIRDEAVINVSGFDQ